MKNRKNYKIFIVSSFIITLFVFSFASTGCKNSTKKETADSTEIKADSAQSRIIVSIPSALETAILLKNSGISFDANLLNPVTNEKKYISTGQKAINL